MKISHSKKSFIHRTCLALVGTLVILISLTGALVIGTPMLSNLHANAAQAFKFSSALIGDMPYGAKGVAEFPNVIAEINAHPRINLSLLDGEATSGKDKCTDELLFDAMNVLEEGFASL